MQRAYVAIVILFFALLPTVHVIAGPTDTFRIHTDLPYIDDNKKLLQDIFYTTDTAFEGSLQLLCYRFNENNDSVLVFGKKHFKVSFKEGLNRIAVNLSISDTNTCLLPKFYQIIKKTEDVPPGQYKIYLSVKNGDKIFQQVYLHDIDSMLSPHSPIRGDINKSLQPKSRSFLGRHFNNEVNSAKSSSMGSALHKAGNKIGKAAKQRGLTQVQYQKSGKNYIDFYYEDWFVGRYEAKSTEPLAAHLKQQENLSLPRSTASLTTNGLDEHPSLFSQFRKLGKEKKDEEEIKGEISLSSNFSTGQEQSSDADNNFSVISARVELPILGMPVQFEGLYTTQDQHQQVKASYFRMHYDVDKAKSDLAGQMNSYSSKYSETKAKGLGMEQVYQTSIKNLEGQKAHLENEVNSEKNKQTTGAGSLNTGNLQNTALSDAKNGGKDMAAKAQDSVATADSTGNAKSTGETAKVKGDEAKVKGDETKVKDEMAAKKREAEEKERKIKELDKKIEKFKTLLAQYRNTNYFDSVMGYNKMKSFDNQSESSYKQMAKRSENILPNGAAKKFLVGITNFDAGIFPKYESKYTMSGQTVKGLDLGYDIGICEVGGMAGKTEYIGRDGTLDKYTCYSARAVFKKLKRQKIMLLYYGYSPDQKYALSNSFFSNKDITAPSFFSPVSIISVNYDGIVSKYVTVSGEIAGSYKKADKTDVPNAETSGDNLAYRFSVDGNLPFKVPVALQASYDKTGLGFENNTLPVSMSGREQYKLAGKTDLFRSFVTIGLEYDYMVQGNFGLKATSTKWGFDFKTNSKRYPSLAISYKPFTTFSSYTDTLNIPQRPLLGSVTTGRLSYQLKDHGKSLRFSMLYNKSSSSMDTIHYGNTLTQASCTYTDRKIMGSLSAGEMQTTGVTPVVATVPNNTKFISLTESYVLSKEYSVSGGEDVGFAPFGLCRFSVYGGVNHHFKKIPLTVIVNLRYNTYELNEGEGWTKLYSGNIDLVYKLKTKVARNNNRF